MAISKIWDGEGNRYAVEEDGITKIESEYWYAGSNAFYPIPSPCFSIYKNNKLWRKFYSPKITVEYTQ